MMDPVSFLHQSDLRLSDGLFGLDLGPVPHPAVVRVNGLKLLSSEPRHTHVRS